MRKLTVVLALAAFAACNVEWADDCALEADDVRYELAKSEAENETLRLSLLATQAENDELSAALVLAIDTNRNGRITCAEAEAAGVETPVGADQGPAYSYMRDGDGDGTACD